MIIDEKRTYFLPRPDNGEPASMIFELTDEWYALDGDKLVLPIDAIEKNGDEIKEGIGLLSQYGSSELLLSMASSDQEIVEGSRWMLSYRDDFGFLIEPA